jgi:hypothetical protein
MVDVEPEVIEVDEEGKDWFEKFATAWHGVQGDERLVLQQS